VLDTTRSFLHCLRSRERTATSAPVHPKMTGKVVVRDGGWRRPSIPDGAAGKARTACRAGHFPMALFITGVALDWAGRWTRRAALAGAGLLQSVDCSGFGRWPVIATGLACVAIPVGRAEGKGILLLHLALGGTSSAMIWVVWWVHFRVRRQAAPVPGYLRMVEVAAIVAVGLTGHLGGF